MSISSLGSLSPSRNYGVGVLGAKLAVPVGAVAVTTSDLESKIGSEAAGTDFALAAGTYTGNFSNKANNGYYGDPNDPTAVVFDGEATYPNLDLGTAPDGGATEAFAALVNNTWANMTFERYIGQGTSGGPIEMSNVTGCLFQNIIFQHNTSSGHRHASTVNVARFCTSKWNGRYGYAGSGADHDFYNCEAYANGDQNMVAQGQTPQVSGGDRGISKFVHSQRFGIHECYFHDIDDGFSKGLWFDINNRDVLVEDSLFERLDNQGVNIELSHGATIRRSVFRECATTTKPQVWRPGVIHCATSGPVTVEYNDILNEGDEGKVGILLYQNNRDTEGDNQNPQYWDALCTSVVRDNRVENMHFPVAVNCTYTKDDCNFFDDPEDVTIENNDIIGAVQYYRNGSVTPSAWASEGYS